jgi:hypothetical protein
VIHDHVSEVEDRGSRGEAEWTPLSPGCLERLLDQFEGDGTDQGAGAERHDQAEGAAADREAKYEKAAEHERGAGHDAPEEGPAL